MPKPILFEPASGFWEAVDARLPSNEGHAQNIFDHGPFVGTVGEVAFEFWFKNHSPSRMIRHVGETWRDYVIATKTCTSNQDIAPPPKDWRDELSVEVKTKLRTSFSLPNAYAGEWEVSVPDYLLSHLETTSKPDVILAVSVQSKVTAPCRANEIESIVVIGWIPHGTFMNWKVWIPKGTKMGGGRRSPKDMWNVYIRQLKDLRHL